MFHYKFFARVYLSALIIKSIKGLNINNETIFSMKSPRNSSLLPENFAAENSFILKPELTGNLASNNYGNVKNINDRASAEGSASVNEYTESLSQDKNESDVTSVSKNILKVGLPLSNNDNIYKVQNIINQTTVKKNNSDAKQEANVSDNYGLSVALFSDIMLLKAYVEHMDESLCKNQSLRLVEGLFARELWALKMYDAAAKSSTGLLWGDTFQLGNFDECINTGNDYDTNDGSKSSRVEGQYCLANIKMGNEKLHELNTTKRLGPRDDVHWAFCIPSSCNSDQLQEFVSSILITSTQYKVKVQPTYCHANKAMEIDIKDIVFICLIGCFIIILMMCTIYHLYITIKHKNTSKRKLHIIESVILCFSLGQNLKKIFSVKRDNKMGLDCISGVRTFSMIIILSGHVLIFALGGPVMNTDFYGKMYSKFENALYLSSPLLVDTFLMISAFLMCRLFLSELDIRRRINVIPIYITRYVRLTFSYFVVIAFYATWMDKLGSGPLWDSKMAIEKERCLESWWANILYINNYVNTDKLCMFQSWYLSVDTQLFFLAPAIIYPLWKWPRIGECILGICTLLSLAVTFFVTYWYQLDAVFLPFPREVNDMSSNYYFKDVYVKTHMRATSYCIGLIFGYILYKIQTTGYKFTKTKLIIYWTLACIGMFCTLYSVTVFYQPDYVYNEINAAIYSALNRLIWSISSAWTVIACATNNGGYLNDLLTWKPLIPLGRLTYCAYLVNGIVELYAYSSLRSSIHLNVFDLTIRAISHFIQTFSLAIILSVMFESPIHGFEKILLRIFGGTPGTKTSKINSDPVASADNTTDHIRE